MTLNPELSNDLRWGALGGFITIIVCYFIFGAASCMGVASCKPVNSPVYIDAGTQTVGRVCTLLEGVTQNQTLVSICATVEEIAEIVSFLSPFLKHQSTIDGGTDCKPIPGTSVCATERELGDGISMVIRKRQLVFLIGDGGF